MGRRRKRKNDLPKIAVLSTALALCVGGLGYATYNAMGQPVADHYACYDDAPQRHSFVLFDASHPRLNKEQGRSIRNYFDNTYDGLGFNEKLSFVTTEGDVIASPPKARFHICGGARNAQELETIGVKNVSAGFIKRQKERLYNKLYAPQISEMIAPSDAARQQKSQSPIMEMIKGISDMRSFGQGSRLIIVSDLLQHSESGKFCVKKNNMPAFSTFRKGVIYQQRLKPQSMDGVEVTVLMVQRSGYGSGFLKYCHSEEELSTFWKRYFKDNGAANIHFIRIRNGNTVG